ncbi:hypothetical protein [Rufibacter ruber]|uniref:hypothetical protein n=1 Tax=Rufibacter ruber TaxID=1783499 RepID=UPI000832ECC8|nr:hypothetical protein [Rufibacter ruber]
MQKPENFKQLQRNAALKDLFPKRIRKRNLGIIGNQLGIQIDYFQAPGWFQLAGAAALIASFVLLFFNKLIGACTFIFTLSLTFIANTWGVTLPMNTLGDLVERITMDNLMKLREDKSSINPKEIRMTILKRIDHLQGLEKRELAPEQKIVFG